MKNVNVSLGVIINPENGKVWIQKRKSHDQLDGLWEFPGGKIETGEIPLNALRRELIEEVGLTINSNQAKMLGIYPFVYSDRRVNLYVYLVKQEDKLLSEGQWVSAQELEELEVPEANKKITQDLQRLLSQNRSQKLEIMWN